MLRLRFGSGGAVFDPPSGTHSQGQYVCDLIRPASRATIPGPASPFSLKTAHCAVFRALEPPEGKAGTDYTDARQHYTNSILHDNSHYDLWNNNINGNLT
ncbi:MAG: hypothetical protein IKN05_09495, partial [Clostridia bacterium]|nr:hypothetical protein [Clostridia bacterium]